ncbi:uncharacterized protein LOC114533410 [Dendronephthya gigantea]|uniref:uncharacterized protein LOC114533410 n=1 Tax=Dendronephthya gigantea TaxID=151771 RepID=UPI00106DC88E|nr:uncharacterized protein LOC114533410 [Dendronephthya gigantea]
MYNLEDSEDLALLHCATIPRSASLAAEDLLSSHHVHEEAECSLKCLEEETCVAYNYKPKTAADEINCQITNTTSQKNLEAFGKGEWTFFQDLETLPKFFDPSTTEWTLIARFSNADTKYWIKDSLFWYDKITPEGDVTSPYENTDMISTAFWEMEGCEIKISRSDDFSHTALLKTTSDCLQGGTFRSKITGYGDFRNSSWGSSRCLESCPVTYGGQYKSTAGFQHYNCSSDIQSSNFIGFWCHWGSSGAVMMIGGGGTGCSKADHGIGITERKNAGFGGGKAKYDFGSNAKEGEETTSIYSLNLWILGRTAQCSDPKALGMESGTIANDAITASTIYGSNYQAHFARLNHNGGSCSWTTTAATKTNSWHQTDLGQKTIVTGITTQGTCYTQEEWTKSYSVSYSIDGITWIYYKELGIEKVFPANIDKSSAVTNTFLCPIQVRYIRVLPKTWKGWPTMRLEYYGCRL